MVESEVVRSDRTPQLHVNMDFIEDRILEGPLAHGA